MRRAAAKQAPQPTRRAWRRGLLLIVFVMLIFKTIYACILWNNSAATEVSCTMRVWPR